MRRSVLAVCVLLVACEPQLGECDQAAAIRVAYDQANGLPAYEGQAMIIASCGNGSFCHGAMPEMAFGVPAGLTFDVQLAAADGSVDEEQIIRLRRGRFRVVQEGRLILHTVDLDTMPPQDGNEVLTDAPQYVRSDGGDFVPVPAPHDPLGREILRNWLACGAPVVERPMPREDGVDAVVVPPLDLPEIQPTWASVFADLLRRRGCAGALCHGGTDAGFRVTDSAGTYAALVGVDASGDECGGMGRLVVPSDPDASLLLEKLQDNPRCGDRMPQSGIPLRAEDLDAVRTWIADGAPMVEP
ncbi:MAG: hypothetical protein AB7S26_34690 [Sandaracinaceae bacterium]